MPKRSFKTDKRRREIAKRKKREEKLQRKRTTKPEGEEADLSYLEYLYPGGIPADVAAEHGLVSEDDAEDDEAEDDRD